jgi:two-component system, cell cycle response regulator
MSILQKSQLFNSSGQESHSINVQKAMDLLASRICSILSITLEKKGSAGELAEILSDDTRLTKKILEFANNNISTKSVQVTNLKQAIIHLGFNRVRTITIEQLLFEGAIQRFASPLLEGDHFWRHCTSVAIICQSIGERIHYHDLEEAYLAGLFHDIGRLFLYSYSPISEEELLDMANNPESSIADQERTLMGIGHDELGASFLLKCGFSEPLISSVKYHHLRYDESSLGLHGARLTALVQLSDFISWSQGMGSFRGRCWPTLPPETERMINLDRVGVPEIIDLIEPLLNKSSEQYNFPLPDHRLIRENLFQSNLQLGRLKSRLFSQEAEKCDSPSISAQSKMLLSPHQSLDNEVIFENTLNAIRMDLSYDEIWVFRFNQEQRLIVSEQFPGAMPFNGRVIGHQIQIKDGEREILSSLRNRNPVMIYGNSEVEQKLLGLIGAAKAVLAPIIGMGRIHGLAFLVREKSHGNNDEPQDFIELAAIFREMGMALDNSLLYALANERATRDKLTEIMNRSGLDDQYIIAFQNAKEKKSNLSIAMLDIDFFKKFNDRFGHQEGDRVLKLVAQRLKKLTRSNSLVGRYGGEEFMIILKQTSLNDGQVYCERVRKDIEKLGLVLRKRLPGRPLTISIGIAGLQPGLDNPDQLIKHADRALYDAKHTGRNRVAKYQPHLRQGFV